ncbi:alpha/beta hydrolase [Paenibacillus tarimensis]
MLLSKIIDNSGTKIHYLDSTHASDPALTPLVISPGLSETAEEYMDLLEFMLPRRSVVLSYRGRGKSDTPDTGYNLSEHITDLAAVIRDTGLTKHHIMGYSRW